MAFVDRLDAALRERGFEPLIDRSEIFAFEDWWRRIQALIARADTIVFVLSPDSVSSDVAMREVAHAASRNKRFAPIVCRRADDGATPEALRRLNFIFFDDPGRFEHSADALAEALRTDIAWIRKHTEFGEAAHRWSLAGRPNGLLLRSPALEEAESWSAAHPDGAPEPSEDTAAFIADSRKHARAMRVRARRIRIALALLLLGLIAVGGLSYAGLLDRSYLTIQARRLLDIYRPASLTRETERALKVGSTFKECASCPQMVVVPAGEFTMGSPEDDGRDDEHPRHKVAIAQAFAVSVFEITFDQWDACVAHRGCGYEGKNESWGRGLQPMVRVSWNDANAYVTWLSRQTGATYRLLTEAEWEYAARAGSTTRYAFGDDVAKLGEYGWYTANSSGRPQPVGGKKPNGFGLYDMTGNVWEWVQDCYVDSYTEAPSDGSAVIDAECGFRVLRGGSWISQAEDLRPAARYGYTARFRNDNHGFRIARTLSRP